MSVEMRCEHKLHGVIASDGLIEVKCQSSLCGHRPGVVVIHKFNSNTGELVETHRYKDTPIIKKEMSHGNGSGTPVRHS